MKSFFNAFRSIRPAWFRYLLAALLSGTALAVLFVGTVYFGLWGRIPGYSELREIRQDRASEVYSADSVLIGKYYLADRQPIGMEEIPGHVLDALVAIEDERFYRHSGIDYQSLMRVFFKTLLLGESSAGGGSTLSQQLAKNLYPRTGSGTVGLAADKVREMFIARRLERLHEKKEILRLYLNTVSFGDNSFGIESAARKFFNVKTRDLKPEQAAALIGMLKATHSYNPRLFPDRSLERRNLVLGAMARNGYLEDGVADSLQSLPLVLDYRPYTANEGLAAYFREAVRRKVSSWLGDRAGTDSMLNLYTSGLKIYTTLERGMQQVAERTMQQHMKRLQADFEKAFGNRAPWKTDDRFIDRYIRSSPPYKKLAASGLEHAAIMDSLGKARPMVLADWEGEKEVRASTVDSLLHYARFLNTGSLAIDPRTGAVLSWVGGVDFKHFKYDHISQSRRQVGSTFKPVVYTAALEKGLDPCDYFSAREVRYENLEDWTPSNSGDKEEDYLNYSMQEALRNSVNTVAVKVLEETGIPRVLSQAKAMGIGAPLPETPSLALGTGSIGIPEMAGAYASYINDAKPVTPYLIRRITDRDGNEIYRHEEETVAAPAYSERTRQLMLQMLRSVVEGGTASRIRGTYGLKGDIAGKTGTTQNNKDAWFVALTPRLVHVSWVGLESHEIGFPNTRIGQGANAALPLFALWYQGLSRDAGLRKWTGGSFPEPGPDIANLLDCPPVKRDGFFKRLFSNPDKAKTRKFRDRSGD
ncbi:transglycosylase domain-containing protein [Robiginitalea sp. SC105]|uniref:transglycosylase domain-containing protein n=1 Tax=Robiginitalea sp. SC105 TaxID=2762332 RepID=UPI00351C8DE8